MRTSIAARYLEQIADDLTMYVVANRTDAVFYQAGGRQKFHFVDRLSNKKGHLTETELVSDRPGRNVARGGGGVFHHSLDRRFTHHEHAAKSFAKRIATSLGKALQEKRFRDLVLVAEPHFLGLLRGELDHETLAAVKHEVGREYSQGSDAEIHSKILKAIRAGTQAE